ncbi:MAG TPA: ATP-binding protein [Vicinamibacterales bacterium]|nr:ATP-binding protein [Vicinamibacterales bacterium]
MKSPWAWRKNYRVWEANRRVFLYPQSWVEPELRPSPPAQFSSDAIVKVARAQRTSALFTSTTPAAAAVAGRTLAAELGRDLYRVDLTHVISKYIGETEKNLDRVFAAAAEARAVLLLDEADALFGTRTDVADSKDPFASAEVGYLLQRIEKFDGLVILASNANPSTVETLARRFAFVVDLPA